MHNALRVVVAAAAGTGGWLSFENPVRIIAARRPADVIPALEAVERAVGEGLHAAGFLSYEAAPGLDSAFRTAAPGKLPLLCLGLFENVERLSLPDRGPAENARYNWLPAISAHAYRQAIARIRDYLRSGDTYQVNYSMRMRSAFRGDPWRLFLRLHHAQNARYSAFVECDEFALASASPELFFSLEGNMLESRPMKGTARRGLWYEQDEQRMDDLRMSPKNRAENVMIVDMVRNDMGRIAAPGTVRAASLFDIERYSTVLQMTSRVTCRTEAPFTEIIKALFPCASITGAPKVRTMEIIRDLEQGPRGIYTGAIGYLSPGRRALFNVAIRTVAVDKIQGSAEYGVGGGIVWDSDPEDEYEECLTKAAVLGSPPPDFELLETLLWESGIGFFLEDEHLKRMRRSAVYFGFRFDEEDAKRALQEAVPESPRLVTAGRGLAAGEVARYRVRLLLRRDGAFRTECARFQQEPPEGRWRVALAAKPLDAEDPFLYHKTTNRDAYESAREDSAGFDDVILWNRRGEVTESTIANIVVEKEGRLITPPVRCGLLPGVFRGRLLAKGEVEEKIITIDDLKTACRIYLVNSVRKWMPADLESAAT